MALSSCLAKLAPDQIKYAKKVIKEAERLQEIYKDLYPDLSDAARQAKADLDATQNVMERIGAKKYGLYQDIQTAQRVQKRATDTSTIPNGSVADNLDHNVRSFVTVDQSGRAKGGDIMSRAGSYFNILAGKIPTILDDLRPRYTDSAVDKAARAQAATEMRKALYGEEASAAGQKAAKEWVEMNTERMETLRAMGVNVPKGLENSLPKSYDAARVLKVSKEEFVNDLLARWDKVKVKSMLSTKVTDSKLKRLAYQLHDDIITHKSDKLSRANLGSEFAGSKAADYEKAGIIQFKSAADEEWFLNKYSKKSDIYEEMIQSLQQQSHAMAATELLGRNPEAMIKKLVRQVEDAFAREGRSVGPKNVLYTDTLDIYKVASSTVEAPTALAAAATLSSITSLTRLGTFGMTVLNSLSDVGNVALRSNLHNLDTLRVLSHGLKNIFSPAAFANDVKQAARMGYIVDSVLKRGSIIERYDSGNAVGSVSQMLNSMQDILFRAQGLTRWTEAFKLSFFLELHAKVADEVLKPIGQQSKEAKIFFKIYDITDDDLLAIKKAVVQQDGHDFVDPNKLELKLAAKYNAMARAEMHQAVLEPTAEVIARTSGAAPIDTIKGAVSKSVFFAQNFVLTQFLTHMRTSMYHPALEGATGRIGYVTKGAVMLTMLQAASSQAVDIAKMKDPRSLTDPNYLLESFVRAGVLGPVGDMFLSSSPATAQSVVSKLGPLGVVAMGLLAVANIPEMAESLAEGKDLKADDRLLALLKRITPGSNLWYLHWATERYVWDNLTRLVNDDPNKVFRQREQALRNRTGQDFYWRPGEDAPDRGPQFAEPKE